MTILLNKPIAPNIKQLSKYLERVNETGWYTNFGPLHNELTDRLQDYLGVENLLLVSNGTLALQVASRVLNVHSAVTTPFSFVATTSSLLWQGIDVAFSDISRDSYNLCPIELEKNLGTDSNSDCIVATHVYGNPCNVDAINEIAKKYNKKTIYDAAHAFGVNIDGRSILNEGDASTLSFHATKVFHTIEGGAIVFKSKDDFNNARELINFGIKSNGELGEPGINAKLNEYQSAVGLTMLDCIDDILEHRSALFNKYVEELKDSVEVPVWHNGANTNGAYMPIFIEEEKCFRSVANSLDEKNIQFRQYFSPSLEQVFNSTKCFGAKNSSIISKGILCLPLHYGLNFEDIDTIVKAVKRGLS